MRIPTRPPTHPPTNPPTHDCRIKRGNGQLKPSHPIPLHPTIRYPPPPPPHSKVSCDSVRVMGGEVGSRDQCSSHNQLLYCDAQGFYAIGRFLFIVFVF